MLDSLLSSGSQIGVPYRKILIACVGFLALIWSGPFLIRVQCMKLQTCLSTYGILLLLLLFEIKA